MAEKNTNDLIEAPFVHFNNHLVDFIQSMREVLPDKYSRLFAKYYKYYRTFCPDVDKNVSDRRLEFLHEFVDTMSKYIKEISICDEGLFSDDAEYYPNKPIYILKNINFKEMWQDDTVNFSGTTKENIWKFLKSLYIMADHTIKINNEYSDALDKHRKIIADMIQALKQEKKIKNDAVRQLKLEQLEEEKDKIDFASIFEVFGEDNLITSIIIEIIKELGASSGLLSNPIETLTSLMGADQSKLSDIMTKIGNKIQEKMKLRGVTEDQLFEDAKKLQDRLMTKFKNIPQMNSGNGMENIPMKIFEYLKEATAKFETLRKEGKDSSDAEGSAEGFADGGISMDDIKKEFEKFKDHMKDIDPSKIPDFKTFTEDLWKDK